jgi:SAM-dependent methyltransferase
MSENTVPGPDFAAEYVKKMSALESDRRTRAAFQELVLRIAPAGGTLLDFGAGPGIDSHYFAQRGFTVAAYEIDPSMCAYFAEHCRSFIDAGRVTLDSRPYSAFLAGPSGHASAAIDLIVANFAPFNLVDDLHRLFARFHSLTANDGQVLASVLNPYFIGDLKYPWWWKRAPRLWREGCYTLPSPQGPLTRRRIGKIGAECLPYFRLERVFQGMPYGDADRANGADAARVGLRDWWGLVTSRFTFLLFARQN